MLLSIMFCVLTGSLPDQIELPEKVLNVNAIRWGEQAVFMVDLQEQTIHKFDLSGKYLGSRQARGMGPGETGGLRDVYLCNNELFLLDNRQQKLVVLDTDLNFKRQLFFQGNGTGAMAVTAKGIFIFAYSPKSKKVVHAYTHQMEPRFSFGEPLETEHFPGNPVIEALSNNGGTMVAHDGLLYLAPFYGFFIERYSEDGEPMGRWQLPGLEPLAFREKDGFVASCKALMLDNQGRAYVALTRVGRAEVPFQDAYWRLDPATNTWSKGSGRPHFLFMTPDATFYRRNRREDDSLFLTRVAYPFE